MSRSASGSQSRMSNSARGRRWAVVLAGLLTLPCPSPRAEEVSSTRLDQCRQMTDRLDRLICFDALASGKETSVQVVAAQAPPALAASVKARPDPSKYQQLTITDFLVDAADLGGKRVEIKGALQQLGELTMLREDTFSMNAFFVDISALAREERRRIFQLCNPICTAIVRGSVASVMMNPGIKADRVEIP